MKSKEKRRKITLKCVLWWGCEWLCGLLLQCIPLLPNDLESGMLLYSAALYVFHPVCAAFFPYLLTRRLKISEYLTFFPIGLCLVLSPTYVSPGGMGCICLLIGLVASCAGAEMNKRDKA